MMTSRQKADLDRYLTTEPEYPDVLTLQDIKDAITMWADNEDPPESELDELIGHLHKTMYEYYGGEEDEGFSRVTLELCVDGEAIVIEPDMWTRLDETIPEKRNGVVTHSERSKASKMFQAIMKDLREADDYYKNHDDVMLEIGNAYSMFVLAQSPVTKKVMRRQLLYMLFLEALRYE